MALWWLGKADVTGSDLESARVKLGEALRAFQTFEMHVQVLGCLEDHAALLQSLGCADDAVRLYATVETFRERQALPRPPRGACIGQVRSPRHEPRWATPRSTRHGRMGRRGN